MRTGHGAWGARVSRSDAQLKDLGWLELGCGLLQGIGAGSKAWRLERTYAGAGLVAGISNGTG